MPIDPKTQELVMIMTRVGSDEVLTVRGKKKRREHILTVTVL